LVVHIFLCPLWDGEALALFVKSFMGSLVILQHHGEALTLGQISYKV